MTEQLQSHPDLDQLRAFVLGKLEDQAAFARIEAHLDRCSECLDRLDTVSGDTLDKLIRGGDTVSTEAAPAPIPPPFADHPRYEIRELLGAGGMGTVYKARHKLMERDVALKVIRPRLLARPASVERFRREVRAAARLAHPNIVTAYDAEQAGDNHFLIMEFVPGQSLTQVLAQRGPLPVAEACEYARQAALGLQHAHEQGMVHRDIKPANLMVTSGVVKILDFGLARLGSEPSPEGALTKDGYIMGTPDYMAPEQADNSHLADIRADIYSLGCTLYQLLAGRPPFPADSFAEKLVAHRTLQPRPLAELRADVPAELARVIERMLAKDPARRYQTPAEAAAALALFVTAGQLAPAARKRRPALLVAAGLLFLIGGGLLLQQVIIRIRDKDGNEREIPAPPGSTVTVVQDGKKVFEVKPDGGKASVPPTPTAAPAEPNRRVAEWALACGGKVRISVKERERLVTAAKDLPPDPFPLIRIDLSDCKNGVTDAALERLKGLTQLTHLYLSGTPVSDAGLQHVQGLTSLIDVHLGNTQVSDAGLANLKGLTKLTQLELSRTRVTDAGMEHLKGLTELTYLDLNATQVSDAGLKHLKGLTQLRVLDLVCRQVTDAGLEPLQGLVRLEHLDLSLTRITDAGLVNLKGMTNLRGLSLSYTYDGITDAGLDKLTGLTKLTGLALRSTAVTDAGLDKLGGWAGLTSLDLGNTKVTADGLKRLQALPELTRLYCSGAQVTDAGVGHLQKLSKLKELYLDEASNTPAMAERLRKGLPNCKIITY